MPSRIINISVALAFTFLAGCSSAPAKNEQAAYMSDSAALTVESLASGEKPVVDKAEKSSGIDVGANEEKSFEPPKPEIQLGTGKFIDEAAARRTAPVGKGEGQVDFNFENNPIQSVVKAILGDLLQETQAPPPSRGFRRRPDS